MKKQGFTLVELLAVIVILAIILAIAVPGISGLIKNVTTNAFEQDAKMIIKAINNKSLMDADFNITSITKENINELLGVGNDNYEAIEVLKDNNGNSYIKIIGKNKWAGLTACGTYTNMQVGSDIECFVCGEDKLIDSRDGKEYDTVQIGNQCWMAENLRYTDDCLVNEADKIWDTSSPHDVCQKNGGSEWDKDEVLYQWGAAQNACPPGWHLPTHDEWTTLERYICNDLGNSDCETEFPYNEETTGWRGTNEGYKLKSISYWDDNGNGDNYYGFNAFPAGYRYTDGRLNNVGLYGFWWLSASGGADAWYRLLRYDNSAVLRSTYSQADGRSVRCLAGDPPAEP